MREPLRLSLKACLRRSLRTGRCDLQGGPPGYDALILLEGEEGQEVTIDTGAVYTWSDETDVGWLRKEAYDIADADLELKARIDGDQFPKDETPAWSENSTAYRRYTDGTKVTWGDESTWQQHSYIETLTYNQSHFWRGYFSVTNVPTADHRDNAFYFRNGEKSIGLQFILKNSSNYARLVNYSSGTTAIATTHKNVDMRNTERLVEVLLHKGGTVKVWFDSDPDPALSRAYSSCANDAGMQNRFGVTSEMTITGRNIMGFRLT